MQSYKEKMDYKTRNCIYVEKILPLQATNSTICCISLIMRHTLFIYLLSLLLTLLTFTSCTRELDVAYPNTPEGNFEALWHIIDTKYCFVEEKGIDWQFLHDAYLPAIRKISAQGMYSDTLFYTLAAMLNHLHDGHVNLYSHFDVSRSREWYEHYPTIYDEKILYNDSYLGKNYRIAGGLHYNVLANGKVGIVRYDSFSGSINLMPIVLASLRNCKGLILDVRHNGGGYITNALDMAAYFFSEDKTIGYQSHKTGEGHTDFSELQPMRVEADCQWDKPVIVLMDRHSYSATNLFVSAMRDADNAMLVGCRSGGGGGVPMSYELPNGWLVRFSSVKMYDAEKLSIEEGISPDISLTWDSTLVDSDPIIDFAVNYILHQ